MFAGYDAVFVARRSIIRSRRTTLLAGALLLDNTARTERQVRPNCVWMGIATRRQAQSWGPSQHFDIYRARIVGRPPGTARRARRWPTTMRGRVRVRAGNGLAAQVTAFSG